MDTPGERSFEVKRRKGSDSEAQKPLGSGGENEEKRGKKQAKVSGTHCGGRTVEFLYQMYMAGWSS